jgi:hypothetical protein
VVSWRVIGVVFRGRWGKVVVVGGLGLGL